MSEVESKHAVVFIFLKQPENKLLMEKRPLDSSYPNEFVFPGGGMEEKDQNNLENTLKRETKEELGKDVEIIQFIKLPHPQLLSPSGKILNAFLVLKWEGEISSVVVDKGNQLTWEDIEKASNSPLEQVRILAASLKDYIKT